TRVIAIMIVCKPERRIAMLDTGRLNIGTYYLSPQASTPEHVRDLAQCGIDVVVNMRNDSAALDMLEQSGVKAIVSGIVPGWFGGDGSNAGMMNEKNPLQKYELAADAFQDHPAIIGIDAGDEPSSLDFPHYGKAIDTISKRFPGKLPYLNIYPSYAVKGSNTPQEIAAQLGTNSYQNYIDRYVRSVNTPYICFDYYLYSADLPGLYESLTVVSDACRKTGREMWMVLQVNSNQPEVFISEEQLRFQAGCALAFGAQTIIWACYCAGWWHNHVLDRQGNKTEQYEKLKAVNAGLHRLGETYMQYRHTETHFVGGFSSEELSKNGKAAIARLDTTCIRGLHAGGTKLLIGQMQTHQAEMPGEFFFAWTVFIGSAYAYRKRQHLGVDILINRLPYRIR
ncbi:MAG: TRAP transporter small permease subunit, partial [Clostridia bacterium]|nr:TRAP transporter small permease subunit [Clostridia bacterium]